MRIALIIERMDPMRGGRETSTAQIASALVKRGHAVTVLCQSGGWRTDGVEVRPLGPRGLTRAQKLQRFVANVQTVLRSENFDVSHAMLPVRGADIYQPRGGTVPAQALASRRRRGPLGEFLSQLARWFNFHRRHLVTLERCVAADPDVLCLPGSEMVAQEFKQYYNREHNVRVVFNAVDAPTVAEGHRSAWRREARAEIGAGLDDLIFLTIAKNFELKGIDFAIKSFARWFRARRSGGGGDAPPLPPARLVVIGRDRPRRYERLAEREGVRQHVHFLRPVRDVFPWYSAADVFLLLSWYDACSRVVLEGARWGVPSITTTYNGAGEALVNGVGIVVERPDDINAVVAGMDSLANPEHRARCARACLHVADRLGMERCVDELIAAYEEVKARK